MGADQQFCLRWNNFHSNITTAFESLRDDEDFVDITLACEGRQIKAHKMVLSACSPYFRSLLKGNPCQHPIVFLKDVTFANLTSILDFMYHGEVNVSHNELATFLKTAEALKVRGLAEDEKKKDSDGYNDSSSPPPSRGDPPDPGSPCRPEDGGGGGGSAPDTHLSGDSPQPPPSKRQRRRSAASLHSAEDNTSETVLSEGGGGGGGGSGGGGGGRGSSGGGDNTSVKNEPQDYPDDEDLLPPPPSVPAPPDASDIIKSDMVDDTDVDRAAAAAAAFGPSDSVTISRSQAAMQQLQESFGSFLPGMGQTPSGFLPQGATDLPRPPPYPLEGVQGLPPGISALPGPSMSQGGAASQEAGQEVTSSGGPARRYGRDTQTSDAHNPMVLASSAPSAGSPGGAGHRCGHCGRLFRSRSNLSRHVRDHHTQGDPRAALCPVCGKDCRNRSNVLTHMYRVHRVTARQLDAFTHSHNTPPTTNTETTQQQQQQYPQQQQFPTTPAPTTQSPPFTYDQQQLQQQQQQQFTHHQHPSHHNPQQHITQ